MKMQLPFCIFPSRLTRSSPLLRESSLPGAYTAEMEQQHSTVQSMDVLLALGSYCLWALSKSRLLLLWTFSGIKKPLWLRLD